MLAGVLQMMGGGGIFELGGQQASTHKLSACVTVIDSSSWLISLQWLPSAPQLSKQLLTAAAGRPSVTGCLRCAPAGTLKCCIRSCKGPESAQILPQAVAAITAMNSPLADCMDRSCCRFASMPTAGCRPHAGPAVPPLWTGCQPSQA